MAWISAAASALRPTAIHRLVSINQPTDSATPPHAPGDSFDWRRCQPTMPRPSDRRACDTNHQTRSGHPDVALRGPDEQRAAGFVRARLLPGRARQLNNPKDFYDAKAVPNLSHLRDVKQYFKEQRALRTETTYSAAQMTTTCAGCGSKA